MEELCSRESLHLWLIYTVGSCIAGGGYMLGREGGGGGYPPMTMAG